ncbi:hypothetical protein BDV11DRAFT_142778 [Aspergillus similis]
MIALISCPRSKRSSSTRFELFACGAFWIHNTPPPDTILLKPSSQVECRAIPFGVSPIRSLSTLKLGCFDERKICLFAYLLYVCIESRAKSSWLHNDNMRVQD